jgi:hypothetical protein
MLFLQTNPSKAPVSVIKAAHTGLVTVAPVATEFPLAIASA